MMKDVNVSQVLLKKGGFWLFSSVIAILLMPGGLRGNLKIAPPDDRFSSTSLQ
jgi:hypothetical protein